MTNETLNKWAHEFLGNCWHDIYWKSCTMFCEHCDSTWDEGGAKGFSNPDYCQDLNLVAKVEAKIPQNAYAWYLNVLDDIVGQHKPLAKQRYINITATAKQRIRACYKTMEALTNGKT